ncbi:extracellular GDSL-like lipase/acylhydrolase [Mycena rebaudengoi]|nr:extracellular GDSL-like lipase/acylhydrolase [Mycena rebaudengoi]
MMNRISHSLTLLISLLILFAQNGSSYKHDARAAAGHWIAAWTSMPQLTEPQNLPPAPFNTSGLVFFNTTLRQTIHVTVPSSRIRLRFSNAFGATDLPITSVTIARPTNNAAGISSIDTRTLKTVTFSGSPSFTVPNGALVLSDPIEFDVKAQTELTITMYLRERADRECNNESPRQSHHELDGLWGPDARGEPRWRDNSERGPLTAGAVTRTKTTAGLTSCSPGSKQRRRPPPLRSQTRLREGTACSLTCWAPTRSGRFDRDVLAQPGITYAMIFEGVNDIGMAEPTPAVQQVIGDGLIAAYKQFIARSHAAGIPIFAATITPFCAPGFNTSLQLYSSEVREATRQRVNAWIRKSGEFDGVVDFDAIIRDPAAPSQLRSEFDSGDFLHPNVAGYQAMAAGFPTRLLVT